MKIRVSKLIAKILERNGITQCFSVTGGGAMYLNDGLGHAPGITTLYMHHEQSCAIAAEAYARVYNKPACLCVTTGPGGTNAITGVVGAWLDSIPMVVISGQVRYAVTARASGTGIRSMDTQEFDITKSIDCMTKYSEMITDPRMIRFALEKCIYLSQTGRPGPCWLDIPLDVQGAEVEEEGLPSFSPEEYEEECAKRLAILEESGGKLDADLLQKLKKQPERITKDSPVIMEIIEKIKAAERPVFYSGNGVRIAGAYDLFLRALDRLGIPVVTGWNNQDMVADIHPLYAGRPGGMGDRPGNFAVQNSDLVFSVGSRLSTRQVGYDFASWAREAYVIVCDIDDEELKKPSVHCDLPIHADAGELLSALCEKLEELGYKGHGSHYNDQNKLKDCCYGAADPEGKSLFSGGAGLPGKNWIETCAYWRKTYPVYQDRYAAHGADELANVYEFFHALSASLSDDQITVVGNGSACVVGGHSYIIKQGSRFISNSAIASMGYDLPAA
ncbi:MAG: thiamine pyrophosphate-binding protein, partial [Eubacteriales bacterium]|nr:thiamine pyrophosphate-binding protein [Eubacteriales bacterium]